MKLKIALSVLLLTGSVSSSWAWGRGGYRGGGVGVVVAPGYYWGAYNPYYYSPYYNPPYGYPYASPPPNYAGYAPAVMPAQAAQPEVASYPLATFEEQIAKARSSVNFQYSDGDISKDQLQKAGVNIDLIEQQARADAAAAGGCLTRAQQDALLRALWTGQPPPAELPPAQLPPSAPLSAAPAAAQPPAPVPSAPQAAQSAGAAASGENLTLVTDQLVRLRRLLDGKLAHGDVTKAQYDGESSYLAQFEKMVRAQASGSGNDLTADQENALLMQLLHVQKSIQQNFIAN